MPRPRPFLARFALVLLAFLATAVFVATSLGAVHAAAPGTDQAGSPVVNGVALTSTMVAGWPVHYDRDVPPSMLATASAGFEASLQAVPRVTGLPPFRTPLAVFLLAANCHGPPLRFPPARLISAHSAAGSASILDKPER
jgi:hypothetical protein